MKEQEEEKDRVNELLKELVEVVREQSHMASGVNLRYIIDGIEIDLDMRPLHGYWIGKQRKARFISE